MTTINVLDATGTQKSVARIADTGQTNMANSLPVAIASDQSPLTTANITNKFREAFEVYTPGIKWTQNVASKHIVMLEGNAVASSYLTLSLDPISIGTTTVETIDSFPMPFDAALGIHLSQRVIGQELSAEFVSTDAPMATPADLAISSISQTTTILTVNTTLNHNLRPGMRIGIRDCTDSRMNYAALVVATTPSPTQFTCTSGPAGAIPSVTAGPFANGYVYQRSALGFATNGTSMIFENAVVTNASFYVRSDSGDVLPSGVLAGAHSAVIASTASLQAINGALTYAFQPTSEYRLVQQVDGIQWSDVAVDSLAQSSARYKRTQVVPSHLVNYKLRFRGYNSPSLTKPVAKVVSAVKTGTTTATVITDVAHGLTTGDYINIFGARDFTNFSNLSAATVVASVIDATTFTVVWGAAVTATTYGGYVSRVNGGQVQQGTLTMVAQSISRTSNIVTVVGSAAWSGALIGDYINIHGVRDAATGADIGLDGPYRVRDIQTTSLILEPIGTAPTGADIASVNCGGGVIKRTDLRISYARILGFERQRVETITRPASDASMSTPVVVQNAPSIATVSSVTSVTTVAAAQDPIPLIIADVASAAITTTTTTAAIVPTFGGTYQVNIPVTAVSGTSPTLDIAIEESDDTGTNWYRVYEFPRITATGMYRSPLLRLRGNRVRYVQTVGGTSPSFTRAINRLQSNTVTTLRAQFVDRTIVPNTLNSTTPVYLVEGMRDMAISAYVTAQTTAAILTLQGSDDGINFVNTALTITTVVGVAAASMENIQFKFARLAVTSAGSGVVLGNVMLKAQGE